MSFGQPLWFIAFALLPVFIIIFLQNERKREAFLRQLVASRLRDRLAGSVSVAKRRASFGLLLLGLACVILSLAQPRVGYTWEQSRQQGRDVLIAIDTSRSMLATDLSPSRIGRAKLAAQDLIGQIKGDRVGLIAFSGTAFLQAPLTADYGAVYDSLNEIDTNIIPRGGTDITAAIKEAVDAFGKGESENRCLVLFTDGEDLEEDAVEAAKALNGSIRIFTVGLGSADGSLIPIPGENGGSEFVKDDDGQFVKSRLDEDRLRKIAEATGGFYVHLLSGLPEMKQIVEEGLGKMKEKDIDVKMSRRPIERYQWPLAAGLAFIAGSMFIGERKRGSRRAPATTASQAALAIALLALLLPGVSQAKNKGLEAYEKEDYSGAQDQFTKQLQSQPESQALELDLGSAAYKAGDYNKALDSFAKAVTSPDGALREAAEYNLGNTLYQRGAAQDDKDAKIREWKTAIQHYEQALKFNEKDEDARYNRDLIQKMIDDLQKKKPDPPQQKQKNNKDDQKKDNKDQQQGGGGGKGGQNKDQQNQQGGKSDSKQGQSQGKDGQQQSQQSGDSKSDQGQGQQQQAQNKDGQNPQHQPQNGDQKNAQNQPQQGKENQQGKEGQQAKNDPGKGEQPQDQTGSGGQKKPAGDIKAASGAPGEDQKQAQQQQEAEEAEAAKEGKMTETQARQLLESLKGEDQRVQLLKPEQRKNNDHRFKDW